MDNKMIVSMIILLGVFITACTPPSEQVMPPVKYDKPINIHSQKKLYLQWQSGDTLATEREDVMPIVGVNGGGLAGAIAGAVTAAVIVGVAHKENPGMYQYKFGNAQQSVFMTSLRDVLTQNHVFKHVTLVAKPPARLHKNEALMKVNFRESRVGAQAKGFPIILSVDMTLKQPGHKSFKRHYFVKSHPKKRNFKNHQINASQQLLDRVVHGIEQWNKGKA